MSFYISSHPLPSELLSFTSWFLRWAHRWAAAHNHSPACMWELQLGVCLVVSCEGFGECGEVCSPSCVLISWLCQHANERWAKRPTGTWTQHRGAASQTAMMVNDIRCAHMWKFTWFHVFRRVLCSNEQMQHKLHRWDWKQEVETHRGSFSGCCFLLLNNSSTVLILKHLSLHSD